MDLNHLIVFVKIVETGSLTKAAVALKQPKSRVSRTLSSLERDLGAELIHRTTRHLQLTDIGRRFFDRCRGPLSGLEEAARDIANCSQEIQGHIRLTAAQDFGNHLMAPIVDEFLGAFPRVSIDLLLTQEPLNLIEQSIDLAIRIGNLKDSSFKALRVAELGMLLVAHPGWVERHTSVNHLDDLEKVDCVGFLPYGQKWTFQNGKEKRTIRIHSRVATNSPDLALQFALDGKGPAILPSFICRKHLQAGSLTGLFRSWKGPAGAVHLVFPYQRQMPPHVRRFADFIVPRIRAQLSPV